MSGNPDLLQKGQGTQSNYLGPLCGSTSKESACMRRPGFHPWVWKIPWRREKLPTPVFLPAEFHGSYSLWGRKESDTTEGLVPSISRDIPLIQIRLESPSAIWCFFPEASQNPHTCICRVSTSPAGQKHQHGSTGSQISRRTHSQPASLRSQVELRDHSRSHHSQNLGSAAPSFSSLCLCPDGIRKVTNHPRLTLCSSHYCRLTSPAPPLPAEPELLFPLIAA